MIMCRTGDLCKILRSVVAIHFDLDGSLVNSETAWFNSEIELLRGFGVALPREVIRGITKNELVGRGQKFAANFYKEKFNLAAPVEDILTKRIDLIKRYYGAAPLMDGAESFLDVVYKSGRKITLATSAPLELADIFLTKHGFEDVFDAVITEDHVENSKPHPDIFLKAAEAVNVEPEESLVVEDSKNGLIAAKRAGMACLLAQNDSVTDFSDELLSKADVIVESLSDLDYRLVKDCLR